MPIVRRQDKGAALTYQELDGNFDHLDQVKADFLDPASAAADFSLTAEAHANRIVYCTKGTAQAVTFSAGHGLADGDSGRLMQIGAGAVTISKDGGFAAGELKLATGVASATTVNDGDIIDWEFRVVAGVQRLTITFRSALPQGGLTLMAAADDQSVTLTGGEDVLLSFPLPPNSLGTRGWAEFEKFMDRTSGANAWTPRLRLGNPTTGFIIGTPGSPTSRQTWRSGFKNLGATNSQISGGTGTADNTANGVPNTGAVDTTVEQTIYLTVQGTAGEVVRCRYLRGAAYFKN